MLDDMAIQLNQEKSDHKEALSDLKLQHEKEVREKNKPHCFTDLTTNFNLLSLSVFGIFEFSDLSD